MLVDDVIIKVSAGKGGDGAVAFNKNMMSLGPVGGAGGDGGDVILEGIADLSALAKFRSVKEFKAENGENGRGQFRDGHCGESIIIKVPVGTIVHFPDDSIKEIVKIGETLTIAKAGRGGKGNFHFRSPINTSPEEFEPGTLGESMSVRLELKFIADVGLIGLPNAGKSSLLNELTRARAKIGDYAFTTLEPNLGAWYNGLVLADIPGLIEGASEGKGLGFKFLKHIERTHVLFHLLAADSENIIEDYKAIRGELKKYSSNLADKKEFVFISKYDVIPEKKLAEKIDILKKAGISATHISIHDMDSIKKVEHILSGISAEKIA